MDNTLSRRSFVGQGFALGLGSVVLTGCGGAAGETETSVVDTGASRVPVNVIAPNNTVKTFKWKPLRIGAGGYVTGLDIAPDGTKVVRCDSAGAFIWSKTQNQWNPLLTSASMPAGTWGHDADADSGVYEIAIAPTNSSRIYVVCNKAVFRTDNGGKTFTKTALSGIAAAPNDNYRSTGRKMAVDPVNPDIVLVATQSTGLMMTADGGNSWQRVASIPNATSESGLRISYDPTTVSGNTTRRVYVFSAGHGVYVSNDGGATFTPTPGSPRDVRHMVCDQRGTVWATDGDSVANARRFDGVAWAPVPAADAPFKTIAINPANSSHIVLGTGGGAISQSFDRGLTWTGVTAGAASGRRVANDIPWLAWTNELYMTSGDIRFDPTENNKLFFAEGIGVWWMNPPATKVAYDIVSQSVGIEQLVSNQFVVPPGGKPIYLAWDRPIFRIDNPDVYPRTHGPDNKVAIISGWGGDYSPTDPNFIVALINFWGVDESGYSTDGGQTWQQFAAKPTELAAGKIGGSIAAGSSDNFMWLPNNNGNPWYTKDRGRTWNQSSVPGVPTSGETGWGWAYYLHRYALVADKVSPSTFYLYNYLNSNGGIFRSTDGGATFQRVYAGEVSPFSGFNAKLGSVPGQAGHLFFTSGPQSGSGASPIPLMRSTDGGANWQPVTNMEEVYAFGFGAPAPGKTYPAIYTAGFYSGKFGYWRSDDNAASWVALGNNPLDNADGPKAIAGDPNEYGKVYVGFGGSGAVYGAIS